MTRALVLLLLAASCGGSGGNVAAAVLTSAVAVTASGVSRATGGCYASCPSGTVCNPATGLCEVLPCRGLCEEDQECDEAGLVAVCVPRKADVTITTEKKEGAPPETENDP